MKNIIKIPIIILFTILSIFFIYKSYLSYKNYQVMKKGDSYVVQMQDISSVLDIVEKERLQDALYLGTNGKSDFRIVKAFRDDVDKSLKSISKNDAANIQASLQYARSRVDVISDDYESILFTSFQDEVSAKLLVSVKKHSDDLARSMPELEDDFNAYVDLITYKNQINKEESFITFILSNSKVMGKKELLIWEQMVANDFIPNFKNITNNISIDNNEIINARSYVAKASNTGLYNITVDRWSKVNSAKLQTIKNSINNIYKYIQKEVQNNTASTTSMVVYAFLASLFLLCSLFLITFKENPLKRKSSYNGEDDFIQLKVKETPKQEIPSMPSPIIQPEAQEIDIVEEKEEKLEIAEQEKVQVKAETKQPAIKSRLQAKLREQNPKNSFNAFEEFMSVIQESKTKVESKNILFNYKIDPDTQEYYTGDASHIKDILEKVIDNATVLTPIDGNIKVDIENSGERKLESAITFTVSNSSLTDENEIKSLMEYSNIGFSEHMKDKSDLADITKNISTLGGLFEIKNNDDKTIISYTLSLKKV